MKYKWLNKKQNKNVIIFFNGWGMDENVVCHLEYHNYDVVMFYDYNTLETDFNFEPLIEYKNRYLIAWSMGVMVATLFNKIEYNSATAINGTLKPINNEFGIPQRIYDLTIKGFNEKGAQRFIESMFNQEIELPKINRDIENQKKELLALKNYNANANFKYNRIILSDNDKIIPTKNQIAFWNIQPNISAGHCSFMIFKSWEELL